MWANNFGSENQVRKMQEIIQQCLWKLGVICRKLRAHHIPSSARNHREGCSHCSHQLPALTTQRKGEFRSCHSKWRMSETPACSGGWWGSWKGLWGVVCLFFFLGKKMEIGVPQNRVLKAKCGTSEAAVRCKWQAKSSFSFPILFKMKQKRLSDLYCDINTCLIADLTDGTAWA